MTGSDVEIAYRLRKKIHKSPAYSRIFYEVWINEERVFIHRNVKQWGDYKNIKHLRNLFRAEIATYPFSIYKIIKSQPYDEIKELPDGDFKRCRKVVEGI